MLLPRLLLLLQVVILLSWTTFSQAFQSPIKGAPKISKMSLQDSPITSNQHHSDLPQPISLQTVHNAMDKYTQSNADLPKQLLNTKGLSVHRVTDWETTMKDFASNFNVPHYLETKTSWHFGLEIKNSVTNKVVGLVTFYIAFSSWDGRILYMDKMTCENMDDETEQLLLRILAQTAVDLGCVRLTWRVSGSYSRKIIILRAF